MMHSCLNCPGWLYGNEGKCCRNFELNGVFFCLLENSVPSVRTETEPKLPNPNFLGFAFRIEPIGTEYSGTEFAQEPKTRIDRFWLTERRGWPATTRWRQPGVQDPCTR
jgi:hypothetical protein